jgi:hypothetical protein
MPRRDRSGSAADATLRRTIVIAVCKPFARRAQEPLGGYFDLGGERW